MCFEMDFCVLVHSYSKFKKKEGLVLRCRAHRHSAVIQTPEAAD